MTIRAGLADTADRVALVASVTCLIHCLALPLLLAALPTLSVVIFLPESFHVWMVALAVPTSTVALIMSGAARTRPLLLFLGASGLLALAAGALIVGGTVYDPILTVLGGVLLGATHILNWRHRRACRAA